MAPGAHGPRDSATQTPGPMGHQDQGTRTQGPKRPGTPRRRDPRSQSPGAQGPRDVARLTAGQGHQGQGHGPKDPSARGHRETGDPRSQSPGDSATQGPNGAVPGIGSSDLWSLRPWVSGPLGPARWGPGPRRGRGPWALGSAVKDEVAAPTVCCWKSNWNLTHKKRARRSSLEGGKSALLRGGGSLLILEREHGPVPRLRRECGCRPGN